MLLKSVTFSTLSGLLGLAAVMATASPADAARVCMTDHFHYGSSSGHRNEKIARAEAIASWAGFTAFEYGNAWASYRLARSKGMRCSRSESGWGCNVEAVPCRRAAKRRRR